MAELVPLSQMDPRWKDKMLGFDTITIGKYGCLLTCMTMVSNYYGFNETPDTLNEKMKAVKGFQQAFVIPGALPAALPGMKYRNFMDCTSQPAPLSEIDAYLNAGKPVIIEVDYSPSAGLQNHWVVLYAKKDSDYLIRDPYPYPVETKEVTLKQRYGFAGDAAKIITKVLWLEGQAVTSGGTKVSLDKGVKASFPVYATADGLALRSETLCADYTLLKRVPLNTRLTILEADASAKPKIGVLNQWLPVRDAEGTEGYAAAWYVALQPAGAVSSPPVGAPGTGGQQKPLQLIVKTIDEGVALRSRTEIADATIIKRVPVNTELLVLDSLEDAKKKLGVVYQWMRVKEVTGCEAYVAAWYVTPVNGQAVLGVKDQGTGNVSFGIGEEEIQPVVVRAKVEGLALRQLPLISKDTLIKRLPVDGEMIVLEPNDSALAKIGQMGEWLHVRDVEEEEGYVAAWYVIERPETVIDESEPVLG